MPQGYTHPVFPFVPPAELTTGAVGRTTVAVVGAGPVGLAVAIDLAQRGVAQSGRVRAPKQTKNRIHGELIRENMRPSTVAASARLRFFENAIPT